MHKDAQYNYACWTSLKLPLLTCNPQGYSVKSNLDKKKEDVFTYKLTKTIFASHYHFMAVAAALKLFQQGQNMFFFPKTVCLQGSVLEPAGISQSFAISCFEGMGRTLRLSSVPNACKQLTSLSPGFLSPQVSMMLPH